MARFRLGLFCVIRPEAHFESMELATRAARPTSRESVAMYSVLLGSAKLVSGTKRRAPDVHRTRLFMVGGQLPNLRSPQGGREERIERCFRSRGKKCPRD